MKKTNVCGITAVVTLLIGGFLLFTACPNGTGGSGGGGGTDYTVTVDPALTYGSITVSRGGTPVTKAKANDNLTVTITYNETLYEYVPGSLKAKVGNSELVIDNTTEASNPSGKTFTFDMVASHVIITAEFKVKDDVETHDITINIDGGHGTVTDDMGGKAPATAQVTLTIRAHNGYTLDTITATPASVQAAIAAGSGDSRTFTMPAEAVTVTAKFKVNPSYQFNITVSDDTVLGTVSADKTSSAIGGDVTLTVTPGTNQKLKAVVLADVEGNVLDTITEAPYKFQMPPDDVVITAYFTWADNLVATTVFSDTTVNIDQDGWQIWENCVNLDAGSPDKGRGGLGFEITGNAGWIGFALLTGTDNTIDFNEAGALSFWVRSPTVTALASVTFGDNPGVTYRGEDDQGITINSEWKRMEIPVPRKLTETTNLAFSMGGGLPAGEKIYLDDIVFIRTGVTLEEIILPETYDSPISKDEDTPAYALTGGMSAEYKITITGETVTLYRTSVNFSNWYDITYTIDGTAVTLNDGFLTPVTPGGTFTMKVGFDGKESGEMSCGVNTKTLLMIHDFETGKDNAAMTGWGWEGDLQGTAECHDGAGGAVFYHANVGGTQWNAGGCGFDISPVLDLSGYEKITFWAKCNKDGSIYAFSTKSNGDPELRVEFTAGTSWQKFEIPLTPVNGVNYAALLSMGFYFDAKLHDDASPLFFDTIAAE